MLNLVVAASVAGPVSAAARPQAVPAPVPASIAPLRALPQDLDARYAVAREGVLAAERLAGRRGDLWRAARLREMAVPGRRFLFFDGRDGGRAAEVFGDLATARRIAIVVPGSDTNLDKYGHLHGGALRLHAELGERSAVIAWLGYRTPATTSLGALTPELAETGARDLRTFVRELRAATPGARISLLCHSYGAAVCGRAAPGLDVSAIVFAGAPGAAVDDAAELRTRAEVWAGRGARDWIAHVPHARIRLPFATFGLGTDPVSPAFGARVFPAGDGGHSDYLRAGSLSLRTIARLVSGRAPLRAVGGA
ncbi:alpha/beta hydrolase family protein [Nonomuraea roseoviolacea subsp. roseoviolacea]|uniref:alpha/beta hydrolase n=1 Tax=Nonomuraea roseoviolacea TaxID=103837 RepID=UPI0031CE1A93